MLAMSFALIALALLFALTITTTSAAFATVAASANPATSTVLNRVFMASSLEHDVHGQAQHVHGTLEVSRRVCEQALASGVDVIVLELYGHRVRRVPTQPERRGVLLRTR